MELEAQTGTCPMGHRHHLFALSRVRERDIIWTQVRDNQAVIASNLYNWIDRPNESIGKWVPIQIG